MANEDAKVIPVQIALRCRPLVGYQEKSMKDVNAVSVLCPQSHRLLGDEPQSECAVMFGARFIT